MSSSNQSVTGSQRNYALDLLRVISMLMIVCLHSNSHGNLMLIPSSGPDLCSMFSWSIQALSVCSVDVFVLISGYFLSAQQFKISRVLRLILQTCFYSWLIAAAFIAMGLMPVVSSGTISSLFPVSFRKYWFISAYIGMCLLSPVLNHILDKCSRQQHLAGLAVLVLMFCVWSDILPPSDPFSLSSGSSLTWFVTLYVIVAYVRRYVDLERIKHPFRIYIGICVLLLVIMRVFYFLSTKISLFAAYSMHNYYFRNNSIFVLLAALALFLTFLKMPLHSGPVVHIVKVMAPLTLGVYLIHDNPMVREVIWKQLFPLGSMERNLMLPLKSVGVILLIYFTCMAIDFLRAKLFGLLEASRWYQKMMNAADDAVCSVFSKLTGPADAA